MKARLGLLAVVVGIAVVSFGAGPASRIPSDSLLSDHDKIEKLRLEVAALQDQLAALTQKHAVHTHRLRVGITRIPRLVSCDVASALVSKLCHQIGDDQISVMFAPSTEAMVTSPPGQ